MLIVEIHAGTAATHHAVPTGAGGSAPDVLQGVNTKDFASYYTLVFLAPPTKSAPSLTIEISSNAVRKDHLAISFRNRDAYYARPGHHNNGYGDCGGSASGITDAGQLHGGRAWRIRHSRCN